jgi:hypothetical protein
MYDRNKERNKIKIEVYFLLAVNLKILHNLTNYGDTVEAETCYTYGNLCVMS